MNVNKTWLWLLAVPILAISAQGQPAPPPEGSAPPEPALVQTQAVVIAPVELPPAVAEVIRLSESGVGEDVVLAYIRNAQVPFTLTADHIVYLKDLGITPEIITAILNRDMELRTQGPSTVAQTNQVAPPPPLPPPTTEIPTVTAPLALPEEPVPAYVGQPPVEVNYFYNDLAPYGSWVVLDGYGWCWQPRAVAVNRYWRPYCDGGRWVYTDCGWYWKSDYSWGWAPFHYGRWQLHSSSGWVWLPDRVWGPAWVTWRTGGGHCGWAPLPAYTHYDHHGWHHRGIQVGINFNFGLHHDHYNFVAVNHFGDRDLHHHRVSGSGARTAFNKTTVVNNYTINNNTIVNRGIPIEQVESTGRRQIPRATIQDLPAGTTKTSRWQTPSRSDNVVYRSQPRAPQTPTRAVAQKVDEQNPVIQHPTIVPSRRQPTTAGSTAAVSPAANGRSAAQGSTWQTPQRSRTARTSSTEIGSPSSSTAPTVSAPSARIVTSSKTINTTPTVTSPRSTAQETPASREIPRSTWQTPARTERNVSPQNRGDQRVTTVTPSANAPSVRSQETDKPSVAGQPAPRSTWQTPSRSAQTSPNVVQTAPQRGNPQVYYPKSYPPAGSNPSGPPAAAVRSTPTQAPRSSSAPSSQWQTPSKSSSAGSVKSTPAAPASRSSTSPSSSQGQTPSSNSRSQGSGNRNSDGSSRGSKS